MVGLWGFFNVLTWQDKMLSFLCQIIHLVGWGDFINLWNLYWVSSVLDDVSDLQNIEWFRPRIYITLSFLCVLIACYMDNYYGTDNLCPSFIFYQVKGRMSTLLNSSSMALQLIWPVYWPWKQFKAPATKVTSTFIQCEGKVAACELSQTTLQGHSFHCWAAQVIKKCFSYWAQIFHPVIFIYWS